MAIQAQAWSTWHAVITLEHNQTTARKHMLGRILRLKQSVAWDAWRTDVQKTREVDHVTAAKGASLTRIFSRVINRRANRGKRQWRAAVSVLALEVSKAAETMQLTVLQTTKSRDAEMAL